MLARTLLASRACFCMASSTVRRRNMRCFLGQRRYPVAHKLLREYVRVPEGAGWREFFERYSEAVLVRRDTTAMMIWTLYETYVTEGPGPERFDAISRMKRASDEMVTEYERLVATLQLMLFPPLAADVASGIQERWLRAMCTHSPMFRTSAFPRVHILNGCEDECTRPAMAESLYAAMCSAAEEGGHDPRDVVKFQLVEGATHDPYYDTVVSRLLKEASGIIARGIA